MKIRQGFVSNSSSSSFIITEKKVTTAQVALSMIRHIEKKEKEDDQEKYEPTQWFAKAEEWLLANLEYDHPIVIPWSCNYETWLAHVLKHQVKPDGIYVATCNNHGWWDLEEYNPIFQDDDFHYEYIKALNDVEFLDLTTFEKVKKCEFVDLWERTSK